MKNNMRIIEEGQAILAEMEKSGVSVVQAAENLGIEGSTPTLYNKVNAAKLPSDARRMIERGQIKATAALQVRSRVAKAAKSEGREVTSKELVEALREHVKAEDARRAQIAEAVDGKVARNNKVTLTRKMKVVLDRIQNGSLKGAKAKMAQTLLSTLQEGSVEDVVNFLTQEQE